MDKTQQVINSVMILQDHASDGLGDCGCSHCIQAAQVIADNPKESESVAKLIAKNEK